MLMVFVLQLFPFCVLDHNSDLPQNLLIDLAHRSTQGSNGLGGIEIKDCHEILMVKILFRFQTAAGHQRICDAHRSRRFELQHQVKVIILFQ